MARSKLDSDGKFRAEFCNDRHVCGSSTWRQLLPIRERPADPKLQRRDKLAGEDAEDEI